MRLISESLGRANAIVFNMPIAIGVYFPADEAADADTAEEDATSDLFSFAASTLGGQLIRILAYASMTRNTVLASDELTSSNDGCWGRRGGGKPAAVFRCITRDAFSGEVGFESLLLSSSTTTIMLDDDDGGNGGTAGVKVSEDEEEEEKAAAAAAVAG